MAQQASPFIDRLAARFAGAQVTVVEPRGEVTLDVPVADWLSTCQAWGLCCWRLISVSREIEAILASP